MKLTKVAVQMHYGHNKTINSRTPMLQLMIRKSKEPNIGFEADNPLGCGSSQRWANT
jgi:hypothetical protein